MKKNNYTIKRNFLKKIFIKFCRAFGYELIDQSNFYNPTQNKSLNEDLNIQGVKSIILPMGETIISRKVTALTVIFRSCTNVNMLTQSKKRIFDDKKSEYTFRSLNSIIVSLQKAKEKFNSIKFDIIVIDHNSKREDLNQMQNQLDKSKIKNSIISLNVSEFSAGIKKVNAENKTVTDNQISNMSNINKSLIIAKKQCSDLIYFVEDDYLHDKASFVEMISTYERVSSQLNRELILCPADYPYLYSKAEPTSIFLGTSRHWRVVSETLCTFLTSSNLLEKHWDHFVSMCLYEHLPFEEPLHKIYKTEYCISPIPSLALHFTNVNSVYGLSPLIDWKKIWDENSDY